MKLYADTPGRRGWQLVTDLFVVAWLWFWIWLATKLYGLVLKLGVPGQKLAGAGDGLADAGSKVHRVPVAGDSLAGPFTKAADAARSLADAGREEQQVVHQLAWVLALLLLAVPVALVLLGWLPLRLRWIRRAGAAPAEPATTCSRCGRWPPSRYAGCPRWTTTRSRPGARATRKPWPPWPTWNCAGWAYAVTSGAGHPPQWTVRARSERPSRRIRPVAGCPPPRRRTGPR